MALDESLELGSPEAAVRSCVSLIAAATGQSENYLAYWLDLYYQVRDAYEAAKAEARLAASGLLADRAPAYPAPRRMMNEVKAPERSFADAQDDSEEKPLVQAAAGGTPERSFAGAQDDSEGKPRAQAAAGGTPERSFADAQDDREEDPGKDSETAPDSGVAKAAKKSADSAKSTGKAKGPTQKGREPWSAVKREIRERFLDLRHKGMTIAQAVNLSGGKASEGEILAILNAGKAEMKVYNALEDAMNKWETIADRESREVKE